MSESGTYFPFYPDKWLESEKIFEMSLEEEGAYIRLLAAMWKRKGKIPDNEKLISNILRCSPAKWRKIRKAFLGAFCVVKVEEEMLFNEKLLMEFEIFSEKSRKCSAASKVRWEKVREKEGKKDGKTTKATLQSNIQPLSHKRREEKSSIKEVKEKHGTGRESGEGRISFVSIISYLNEKARKEFKPTTQKTRALIRARVNEGFSEKDFYAVIDSKVDEWLLNSDMSGYLRPETLFGNKFEGYLQGARQSGRGGDNVSHEMKDLIAKVKSQVELRKA